MEGQELGSNVVEGTPSQQSSCHQTHASMNDNSLTDDKREGGLELYYNYSVVRKTKNTSVQRSSGMSVIQQPELDDSKPICEKPHVPSKPSLETKEHLYANVRLKNLNHDSNPCSPRGNIPKVPGEHADETGCKTEYIYAVVDKTRKRSSEVQCLFHKCLP